MHAHDLGQSGGLSKVKPCCVVLVEAEEAAEEEEGGDDRPDGGVLDVVEVAS